MPKDRPDGSPDVAELGPATTVGVAVGFLVEIEVGVAGGRVGPGSGVDEASGVAVGWVVGVGIQVAVGNATVDSAVSSRVACRPSSSCFPSS